MKAIQLNNIDFQKRRLPELERAVNSILITRKKKVLSIDQLLKKTEYESVAKKVENKGKDV